MFYIKNVYNFLKFLFLKRFNGVFPQWQETPVSVNAKKRQNDKKK